MYLSNQEALVCTGNGQRFSALGDNWATVLAMMVAQLDGQRWRGGLQVLLSAGLARPFMQAAVSGIDTREEALQVAKASAPEITALDAPCAVWMEGWVPGKACLAAAVEERLLDALLAFAQDRNLRLRSVRPWWDAAVNDAWSRADNVAMVTLKDQDTLVLMVASGKGHEMADVFCYTPVPDAQQREGTESRIAFAAGLGTDEVMRAEWITHPTDETAHEAELGRVVWADGTGT